jgi:predicted permease
MAVFSATLNQTAFLFLFIVAGYILSKTKLVPDNAQGVLSKLEQYIFIPALVLGTFISGFSPENLTKYAKLLLGSSALASSKSCAKWCIQKPLLASTRLRNSASLINTKKVW